MSTKTQFKLTLELADLMDRLAGYAEVCLGYSRGAWSAIDNQYDNDAKTARAFATRIRKDLVEKVE